jgi:putative oxidoreductase
MLEKLHSHSLATLVLRLTFGGLMLMHGWPKLQKLMAGGEIQWADPIGLGPGFSLGLTVIAEFLCAILVLVGLGTRFAAIPLAIVMLVASQIVHRSDPWGEKEHSLLYLGGYLAILMLGGGKYSLDGMIGRKKS